MKTVIAAFPISHTLFTHLPEDFSLCLWIVPSVISLTLVTNMSPKITPSGHYHEINIPYILVQHAGVDELVLFEST